MLHATLLALFQKRKKLLIKTRGEGREKEGGKKNFLVKLGRKVLDWSNVWIICHKVYNVN